MDERKKCSFGAWWRRSGLSGEGPWACINKPVTRRALQLTPELWAQSWVQPCSGPLCLGDLGALNLVKAGNAPVCQDIACEPHPILSTLQGALSRFGIRQAYAPDPALLAAGSVTREKLQFMPRVCLEGEPSPS